MPATPPLPFQLVYTPSGACTLRALHEGETFHPGVGPQVEAEILHVRGQRLAARAAAKGSEPMVVWDVGLGAAANAIAAIQATSGLETSVHVHSFENDLNAARFALQHAEELRYVAPLSSTLQTLLEHGEAELENVRWTLHHNDFSLPETWARAEQPDAILYDPYSPKANPGLWNLEHFTRLREHLGDTACTLSSYSRSSAVRVTLMLAGFFVGHGPASGEKDQTTLASTDPTLLHHLLDSSWLQRVYRSTAGAPLHVGRGQERISASDWTKLLAHPQFEGADVSWSTSQVV